MNYLGLSGLAVVLSAWLLMIVPSLLIKKNNKINTISEAVNSRLGRLITLGILLSVFFQVLYSLYFYRLSTQPLSYAGIILFVLSSLSFLMSAFISFYSDSRKHTNLIKTYFVLMSVGLFLIGLEFFTNYLWVNLIIPVMFFVTLFLYKKKLYWLTEIWVIFNLSVWAVAIYIINEVI